MTAAVLPRIRKQSHVSNHVLITSSGFEDGGCEDLVYLIPRPQRTEVTALEGNAYDPDFSEGEEFMGLRKLEC
jgi:hypothetical protein